MSFTKCLKASKLSAAEKKELRADAKQYQEDGMDWYDAVQTAITDTINDALAERAEIVARIEAAGGKAPPAPRAEVEPEPAPEVPPTLTGGDLLAKQVAQGLLKGKKLSWQQLFAMADEAYGGTQAEGKYTPKDAYDAMEVGLSEFLDGRYKVSGDPDAAAGVMSWIEGLYNFLPTQTKRTKEQQQLQQFSTPHTHSFAMSWVANINAGDVVLEPSAGTGNLLVPALNAGAGIVYANELSDRRADLLDASTLQIEKVFRKDASHINASLPSEVKPSVVIMNPPFSADINRPGKKDTMVGAKHVEDALQRLEPGGRLVALVGRGMSFEAKTFMPWWRKIRKAYAVRANVRISGKEYAKLGTSFDNQILVIDKVAPDDTAPVTGAVEKVSNLLSLLLGVRNARQRVSERKQAPDRAGVEEIAEGAAPAPRGPAPIQPTARPGDVGPEARPVAPVEPTRRAEPSEQPVPAPAPGVPAVPPGDIGRGQVGAPERPGRVEEVAPLGAGEISAEQPVTTDERGGVGTPDAELESGAVFQEYQPSLKVEGSKKHPTPLSESVPMASVKIPKVDYKVSIPKKVISGGFLSDSQLEVVALAGEAHGKMLPGDVFRRGFFVGNGTGVGKGAEIAGIILDNFGKGRKKAVWVSENAKLAPSAARDLEWVGMDPKKVLKKQSVQKGRITAQEGVMFTTYDTLRASSKEKKDAKGTVLVKAQKRIDQLIEWLGEDFDGVVAFDESHNMGNSLDQGGRGKKAAQKALAGVELQRRLPKARIVYVSATGATEVMNLAYADRLGLWGEGTAFANKRTFINEITSGGVAAMEVVARDMKSMGMYESRSLSYEGVEYDTLTHTLTKDQRQAYNKMSEAWQIILQSAEQSLVDSGGGAGYARGNLRRAFWGTHQRFFNQVITSLQVPSIIKDIEKQVKAGNAAVLQLVNTNEATQERRLAQIADQDIPLEDADLSPRDIMMQYLENSYPTDLYEEYTDEDGNQRVRVAVDPETKEALQDPAAVAKRDELARDLNRIYVPQGALDQIINHFGSDAVAEITGRKRRLVRQPDESVIEEKMTDASRAIDAQMFDDDKKRILIFSDAGGTGRSYHADKRYKNQRRRFHYLVQPGWRADKVMQGFGRTHRTNQKLPPNYMLVTTDITAQKRFLSSIARRLDQLGALTKGSRQATTQGMFSADMNLENIYAEAALTQLFDDVGTGKIEGVTEAGLSTQLGLDQYDKSGQPRPGDFGKLDVPHFLNRLLSLDLDTMDTIFAGFYERLEANLDYARREGTLDLGMETITAQSIKREEKTKIHEGEEGAVDSYYVRLSLTDPVQLTRFDNLADDVVFARNRRSNRLYAFEHAMTLTDFESGDRIVRRRRVSQSGYDYVTDQEFRAGFDEIKGSEDELRAAWDEAVAATPSEKTTRKHLITGALLPIWDRLPSGSTRVYRAKTDEGEVLLGKEIGAKQLKATLRAMGVGLEVPKLSPDQFLELVLRNGDTLTLANGWKIKRSRVSGQNRAEITGAYSADINVLEDQGAFTETIQYRTRVFVPTGEKGPAVFERIIKSKPVVELNEAAHQPSEDDVASFSQPKGAPGVPTEGASVAAVEGWTQPVTLAWDTGASPRIRTVASFAALPERVKAAAPDSNIDGVYHNGMVYLIADKLPSKKAVLRVLAHESIGHHGMELIVDGWEELATEIARIAGTTPTGRRIAAQVTRRYGDLSPINYAKEILAVASEQKMAGPFARILTKVRASIRSFLKRIGLVDIWSAAEIDLLLVRAERNLRHGQARELVGAEPMFSRTPATRVVQDPHLQSLLRKTNPEPASRWRKYIPDSLKSAKQGIFAEYNALKDLDQLAGLDLAHGDEFKSAHIAARMATSPETQTWVSLVKGPLKWIGLAGRRTVGTSSTSPGLLTILQPVRDKIDLLSAYLAARRASRLMREGREKFMTPQEIAAGLRLARSNPELVQVAEQWYAFNSEMLDFAEEAGYVDPESRAMWNESDYVPFYRILEEGGGGPARGKGLQTTGIKRLHGSEKGVKNILENMLSNTTHLISSSMRERALQNARDLMEQTGMATRAGMVPKAAIIPVEQIRRAIINREGPFEDFAGWLESEGIAPEDIPNDTLEGMYRAWAVVPPKGRDIVQIRRAGKPEWYRVEDPLLMRSLTAINHQAFGDWMKLFSLPKQLLTTMVTATPTFQLRNWLRDSGAAFVTARDDVTPFMSGITGFLDAKTRDELFWSVMAQGGGFHSGFLSAGDPEGTRRVVERELKQAGLGGGVRGRLGRLWDGWQQFGSNVENSNRMAIAKSALKGGKSNLMAAFESKDFMDFSQRGDWPILNFLTQTVPFLNARLQGLYRLQAGAGMLKSDRENLLIRANRKGFVLHGLMLTTAAIALWGINYDDDRYKELEEWDKDTNWHFWIGDKHFKIPKPFEVGVVFGTIPERAMDMMFKEGDDAVKFFLGRMSWNALQVFSMNPLPQTVRPIVEQVANRQFFFDRPIEGMSLQGRLAADRHTPWTHDTSRALGSALGVSPARIDHMLRAYTGSVGNFVMSMADVVTRGVFDYPDRPSLRVDDYPVVRAVYGSLPVKATKYRTEFFDMITKSQQVYGSIKNAKREKDDGRVAQLLEKHQGDLRVRRMLNRAKRKITALNARMRQVYTSALSPGDKRKALDEITTRKNDLYEQAVERAKEAKRGL